jgi:hypothetical protein
MPRKPKVDVGISKPPPIYISYVQKRSESTTGKNHRASFWEKKATRRWENFEEDKKKYWWRRERKLNLKPIRCGVGPKWLKNQCTDGGIVAEERAKNFYRKNKKKGKCISGGKLAEFGCSKKIVRQYVTTTITKENNQKARKRGILEKKKKWDQGIFKSNSGGTREQQTKAWAKKKMSYFKQLLRLKNPQEIDEAISELSVFLEMDDDDFQEVFAEVQDIDFENMVRRVVIFTMMEESVAKILGEFGKGIIGHWPLWKKIWKLYISAGYMNPIEWTNSKQFQQIQNLLAPYLTIRPRDSPYFQFAGVHQPKSKPTTSESKIQLKRIQKSKDPIIPDNEVPQNQKKPKTDEQRLVLKKIEQVWIGLPQWGPNRDKSFEKGQIKNTESDLANANRLSWFIDSLQTLEDFSKKVPDGYKMKKTGIGPYLYFKTLLNEYKMDKGYKWFLNYIKDLEKEIINSYFGKKYNNEKAKIPTEYRSYWQAFRFSRVFFKMIEEIQKGKKLPKPFMNQRKEEYEQIKLHRPGKQNQEITPTKPSAPEKQNSRHPPPFSTMEDFERTWKSLSWGSFNRDQVYKNLSERMKLNSWIRDFIRLTESYVIPDLSFDQPSPREFYYFYFKYLKKHTNLDEAYAWLVDLHQKPKKDWTRADINILVLIVEHYILAITYYQTGKENFEKHFKTQHVRFVTDLEKIFA